MKKNYFSSLLSFLMIAVCATTFVACGDDHEDDGINTIQQEVMNKLAGTWQRVERGFDDVTYNDIIEITFSKYGAVSYTYVNYSSSSTKTFKTRTSNGTYTISNDGTYITSYSCYELNGKLISSLSKYELYLDGVKFIRIGGEPDDDDSSSVAENSSGNSGGSSYSGGSSTGGNSNSGEAPSFRRFDYTATTTTANIYFYTTDRVTSATIYYGPHSTSVSVSATVINQQISATLKGLTKGTKYYVKCTAKNNYGSTTSDIFSFMTNYD